MLSALFFNKKPATGPEKNSAGGKAIYLETTMAIAERLKNKNKQNHQLKSNALFLFKLTESTKFLDLFYLLFLP